MYDQFMYVSVTGDVSVVGGSLVWLDILEEYSSLIKTSKAVNLFQAWRKLEYAEARFKFLNKALPFLETYYDEDVAMALIEMGFDYILFDGNREEYLKQIEMLKAEGRTLVIIISQLRLEYERLLPPGSEMKNKTMIEMEEELAVLSEHQGYYINKKTTTVMEVCAIINVIIKKQQRYEASKKR